MQPTGRDIDGVATILRDHGWTVDSADATTAWAHPGTPEEMDAAKVLLMVEEDQETGVVAVRLAYASDAVEVPWPGIAAAAAWGDDYDERGAGTADAGSLRFDAAYDLGLHRIAQYLHDAQES